MDSPKDSAPGRVFGERLAEKFPPIPESSPLPGPLRVDTESAVRNKTSDSALARTDGQTAEEAAYSQRSVLRSLPGMVAFDAQFDDQSLIMSSCSLDPIGR